MLHESAANETVGEQGVGVALEFSVLFFQMVFHCPVLQMAPNTSHLGDSVCFGEIQVNKIDTSDSVVGNKPTVWPRVRSMLGKYNIHVYVWPV